MIEKIRSLISDIDTLLRNTNSIKTDRVSQKNILTPAVDLVDKYFRSVRDVLIHGELSQEYIDEFDSLMHALLELTHKRSYKRSYIKTLRSLRQTILAIEKLALIKTSLPNEQSLEKTDLMIISTLSKMVPSAALSYEQAIKDLSTNNRISWRGPATDLREALRETLDYLAPDNEIISQKGFKLEKDQTHPTMKQKVRFILRKRGYSASLTQTSEDASQAVDEAVGSFVRSVYTRSSISTHTPTDKSEVLRVRDFVRTALCESLEIHI
jgi:hypothetical protein